MKYGLMLILVLQLLACSTTNSSNESDISKDPSKAIIVGETTKEQVVKLLGKADENYTDDDQSEVWIYVYRVDVPLLVSLIPIVGDITDAVDMAHKDREIVVQFNKDGIVKSYKLRSLD